MQCARKKNNVKNISIIIIFGHSSLCPAMNVDFVSRQQLCFWSKYFVLYTWVIIKKMEKKNIWSCNDWLDFSPSYPCFLPLPSLPFCNILLKVSSTDLTWVWGALTLRKVEDLRGLAGLGGQVKVGRWAGGEGRRAECPWENTGSKQSGLVDARVPMGRKHLLHSSIFFLLALGWAQIKNLPPPMPLQQLGLFQPGAGAKDEAMWFLLISYASHGQP